MTKKKLSWDELYGKLGELVKFDESAVEEVCTNSGWECEYCDSGIDDGITDNEDEEGDFAILYMSFDIKDSEEEHHVLFYYGDYSRIISDFEER